MKELIAELSKFPQDAEVVVDTQEIHDEDETIWRSFVRPLHKVRFRPVTEGKLVWRPRKEANGPKKVVLY